LRRRHCLYLKESALLIQYAEFVRDYLLTRQGSSSQLDAIYETFSTAWNDYGFAAEDVSADINRKFSVADRIEY
jgi:chemosensory pili system protein ChpA (sensor histidine kinase/response regulator)